MGTMGTLITLMGVAPVATAADVRRAVSRFNPFDRGVLSLLFQRFIRFARLLTSASIGEIAGIGTVLRLRRASSEVRLGRPYASARLSELSEHTAKTGLTPRAFAPTAVRLGPTSELDSRVTAPRDAVVEVLGWPPVRGHGSLAVATTLATVVLEVDSPLATRAHVERKDPWLTAQLA